MVTPTAWGDEFLVNTTVLGNQYSPTITTLSDGRFVVAWTDESQTGSDSDLKAIRAQVFSADGSRSSGEFLVNTTTNSCQSDPTTAALSGGRFAVAWADNSQSVDDPSGFAVRSQVFNANGTRAGSEFLVNTTVSADQYDPTITTLSNGRFVVSWSDNSQIGGDTSQSALRAQMFNADGSRVGGEFQVNSTTVSYQVQSTITALTNGRFVVAWTDISQSGGDTFGDSIRAQVFNANGSRAGGEFLVNTTVVSNQVQPSITALSDGRFVVAWEDDSQSGGDTSFWAVRAQVFNSNGSPSGGEFLVTPPPIRTNTLPRSPH